MGGQAGLPFGQCGIEAHLTESPGDLLYGLRPIVGDGGSTCRAPRRLR